MRIICAAGKLWDDTFFYGGNWANPTRVAARDSRNSKSDNKHEPWFLTDSCKVFVPFWSL